MIYIQYQPNELAGSYKGYNADSVLVSGTFDVTITPFNYDLINVTPDGLFNPAPTYVRFNKSGVTIYEAIEDYVTANALNEL